MSTATKAVERERVNARDLTRPALILGGFLLLTLLLRLGSFGRSVIDFDESYFLILGRSLLRGETPYLTYFEHSPLGSFALFAAIQALFGQSVAAIRIATVLAAGLASFLVYLLAKRIACDSEAAGLIAGLVYAVYTLFNLGLAAHREMFLAPLIAFAMLMVLPRDGRPRSLSLLAAGVAVAAALQLKYMYVFEAIGVALAATLAITLAEPRPLRASVPELLRAYLLLTAPAFVIVAAQGAYFAAIGYWPEFARANFGSPAAYVENRPYTLTYLLRRLIWQARSNLLVWLGPLIAAFLLLPRDSRRRRIMVAAMLAWFLLALLGATSTGRYWDHYYLQLVAPGAVLTGVALAALLDALPAGRRAERAALLLFALAPMLVLMYLPLVDSAVVARRYLSGGMPADGPARVSAFIKPRLQPGDAIYVADYEPLIYYLVDARIPTQYPFPPHLTNPDFAAIGIPQMEEFRRIMDNRPLYVVKQEPPSADMANAAMIEELAARLARDYVLEKEIPAEETFGGRAITAQIYRLK